MRETTSYLICWFISFPNAYKSPVWAGPQSGARKSIWVFPATGRAHVLGGSVIHCLPKSITRRLYQKRRSRTRTGALMWVVGISSGSLTLCAATSPDSQLLLSRGWEGNICILLSYGCQFFPIISDNNSSNTRYSCVLLIGIVIAL